MNTLAGKILISAPALEDPNFNKAVIFITGHDEKGAMGFVINKIFPRAFNELLEFKQCRSFPLYAGGPVEHESLYFLHCRPGIITGSTLIADHIYLGGNFKLAVQAINDTTITGREIKLFVGYCGWDFRELETEIEEGSWLICDGNTDIVFTADAETLWEKLYETSI